jgi:hypothetical protein
MVGRDDRPLSRGDERANLANRIWNVQVNQVRVDPPEPADNLDAHRRASDFAEPSRPNHPNSFQFLRNRLSTSADDEDSYVVATTSQTSCKLLHVRLDAATRRRVVLIDVQNLHGADHASR